MKRWTKAPEAIRAHRHYRMLLAGLAVIAMGTASCGDDPQPSSVSPYVAPSELTGVTSVWTAEPGLDLVGEHGTLVRGAAESEFIARVMQQPAWAYYGFEQAVSSSTGEHIGAEIGAHSFTGTVQMRLMSLAETPDGFEGLTCLTVGGMARDRGDGSYTVWPIGAVGSTRVQFIGHQPAGKRNAPSVRKPTADNPNPASSTHWQSPTGYIFGDWQIKIVNSDPVELQRCRAWGHALYPPPPNTLENGGILGVLVEQPPPTLPAFPGWPR